MLAIKFNGLMKLCVLATLATSMALLGASSPLSAQEQTRQQAQQQPFSQQEIELLVAPIALYPDALLAQVLTASTYPLEVVMAARWSEKNPNVERTALEEAMREQPWDPSIKGLVSVPQVLAMMSDKLDWTTQLGEAFLAQPDDVQNAIQTLRAKAEAAGNLKSSKELKVRQIPAPPGSDYVGPPEYIVIEPVEPDYVYVPVYNPLVVFGVGFWAPGYLPFFWYPPWWTVGPVFGFGPAVFVGPALWYNYNWGYRGFAAIRVNRTLYRNFNRANFTDGNHWKFNPAHHKATFKNIKLQQQFVKSPGVKGVTGVQTKKGVKTFTTNKGVTGVQTKRGVKTFTTNKGVTGVQTKRGVKTFTTNKGVTGVQAKRGVNTFTTNKGVKGVRTHKSITTGTIGTKRRR